MYRVLHPYQGSLASESGTGRRLISGKTKEMVSLFAKNYICQQEWILLRKPFQMEEGQKLRTIQGVLSLGTPPSVRRLRLFS